MLSLTLHRKSFNKPVKSSHRRSIICRQMTPDDIPYSEKYKDSRSAQYALNSLENMLNADHKLDNEQFANIVYDKWNKYHKVDIKEFYGKIHLVINHSSYIHKFIALSNYDKIVKRLNALHLSFHIYSIINEVDFPDDKKPLIISLGMSSYCDDPREEEWRI